MNPLRLIRARVRLVTLLVSLTLVGALACTPDQEELIRGILQNVDSISGEVTVTLENGETMTINLQDLNLQGAGDSEGSLALGAGDEVTLAVDNDDGVSTLTAHAAEVEGIITSVDPDARTLTVDDGEPLQVTDATKIELDGENGSAFDALVVGQEVEVKFDPATREALKIEVEDEEDEDEPRTLKVEGILVSVDPETNSVRIREGDGTEQDYVVKSDTKVRLPEGVVGLFGDLPAFVNREVKAKVTPDSTDLLKLKVDAEGEEEEGEAEVEDDDDGTEPDDDQGDNNDDDGEDTDDGDAGDDD